MNEGKINMLITSASRKVNLIQSFKAALRQASGGEVIAVDISVDSAALFFADDYYIVPRSDSPNFISSIIEICKTNEIKCIIPTRDEELLLFSKNRKMFVNQGIEVMIGDVKTIETCQNKKRFNDFCKLNNIPVPVSYNLSSKIEFPVFVKPVYGKASNNTFKAESYDELELILKKHPDSLIQEFIDCLEYTIDIFTDFDSNVVSVVPRERVGTMGGESFVTKTFKNDIIIEESINLAEKLKLIGHNTIQCFYKDGDIKFIEVNPRYGGAANCGFAAGAFTPLYLIKLLNGEKVEPEIGNFKDNLTMLRYTHDIFPENIKDNGFKNDGNNTIAIDFDGVIHKYSKGWYDGSIYDSPVDGAVNAIKKMGNKYKIVILTARSNVQEIEYWINENIWGFEEPLFNIEITNTKPAALMYIDDKGFNFSDWDTTLNKINKLAI